MPSERLQQLALFFGIFTPGQEKSLREGFGLEPNPRLEDVKPAERDTPEKCAALLETVRDRIRLAFPDHIGGQ